jgi:hypothetical protein
MVMLSKRIIKYVILVFIFAILTYNSHTFQLVLEEGEKQCFLQDLKQQQRFVLSYEISDQDMIEDSEDIIGVTFRCVDTHGMVANDSSVPQGTGSYVYFATQEGRYEYCFIRENGESPSVVLTFHTTVTPTPEEQIQKNHSSMTKENQLLMEDLRQLLYATLTMQQDQKTLAIREERHKQSKSKTTSRAF